jgi:hypothetical protein
VNINHSTEATKRELEGIKTGLKATAEKVDVIKTELKATADKVDRIEAILSNVFKNKISAES